MLREHTAKFGVLHEAQVLQLKLWPRVLIPTSTKSKAHVDTERFLVEFQVEAPAVPEKGTVAGNELGAALAKLGESVRWLLGPYWTVKAAINGMAAYFLAGQGQPPDPSKYAGTDFEAGRIVPEKPWKFRPKTPSSK